MRVLDEAHLLYAFVLYGLCFDGPWVSFYIKPADGLQLPEIMQWIKQTYACRYNVYDGRTGHIWGDRYWSKVLDGEPPEEEMLAKEAEHRESGGEGRAADGKGGIGKSRKRGHEKGRPTGTATARRKQREIPVFRRISPAAPPFEPASGGKSLRLTAKTRF
jgi:hypothetical protein